MSLGQIACLRNQRFTCLCCTLENLHRLSQGPNPLIARNSNYLHFISIRLHETVNYHFPDVTKQNRFLCILAVKGTVAGVVELQSSSYSFG